MPVPAQLRFLAAGHGYGSHHGDNEALDPRLLAALHRVDAPEEVAFLVLTGDFVRRCDETSLAALQQQLARLPFQTHLVRGNHEANPAGAALLRQRSGETFYAFEHGGAHFVVLDSQRQPRSIDAPQLQLLDRTLAASDASQPVFVLFHELLWLSRGERYAAVRANRRSRQARSAGSNYWDDVHPRLEARAPQPIAVIAGDLGGNPDAVPAFYEELGHVTFMACGMGEVDDGCLLDIRVEAGAIAARCISIDPARPPLRLEDCTPDALAAWPLPAGAQRGGGQWRWVLPPAAVLAAALLLAGWRHRRARQSAAQDQEPPRC